MKILDNILNVFQVPGHFLALEIHYRDSGMEIRACELRYHKGLLSLKGQKVYSDFESLKQSRALPCIAYLSGRKVLTKSVKLDSPETVEMAELLKQAFPAVNSKSVHFQVDQINSMAHVSVIRKEVLDEFFQNWPASHPLIDLQIGPYFLLEPLAELLQGPIYIGGYELDPAALEMVPATEQSGIMHLFGEEVESAVSGAFAYALLFCSNAVLPSVLDEIVYNRGQWKFSKWNQALIKYGLGSVLVLLLFSFLGFSYYNDLNNKVAFKAQDYQSQLESLEKLEAALSSKRNFIANNQSDYLSTAQALDQLAERLPKEVKFKRLQSHPVERIKEKEGKVFYERNTVRILGEAKNYRSFQDWVLKIKSLEWVADLEILGYQELSTGHEAEFILKLEIDPS